MKRSVKASRPKTVATYLATLSPEKRATLQNLRKQILSAAPKAEEYISYGIPAFRLNGKLLVAMAGAANHCSLYPGSVLRSLKVDVKGYDTSKGTIRFSHDKPLPAALVKSIVKARIAQRG
jgi:uncharacterized protein YdhG (YjbR/CyaY superfamily)